MGDPGGTAAVRSPSAGATAVILSLLLLTGGFLRFHDLDRQSLWRDEVETLVLAAEDYGRLTELALTVPVIPVPPLYFYATRLLCFQIPGQRSLRWPAAFFGLLLIPGVWLLGREALHDGSAPLLAAGLATLSPFLVRYSQEARSYSLLALLAVLAAFFWLRSERRGSVSDRLAFVVFSLLGLYTHHFFILALAAGFLAHLATRLTGSPHRGPSRLLDLAPGWWSWALILAGYLPMLRFLFRGLTGPRGLATDVMEANITPADIPAMVGLTGPPAAPWAWVVAGLAVAGLVASRPWKPAARLMSLTWFLLPALLAAVIPFRHVMRLRYLIFIIPFYFLLAGAGLSLAARFRRPWPRAGLAVVCLLLTLSSLAKVGRYFGEERQNWRAAALFLRQAAGPDDLILVDGRGDRDLNTRYRVLDHYAGLGPRIRIINPAREPESWLAPASTATRRLWYVNTLTRHFDPRTAPLPPELEPLARRGWTSFPPLRFDAPLLLPGREAAWIGLTRHRSILVIPLETASSFEPRNLASWADLAAGIPGSFFSDAYIGGFTTRGDRP